MNRAIPITRRPGRIDLTPGVWLLLGLVSAWAIVLFAAAAIQIVASAAVGVLS